MSLLGQCCSDLCSILWMVAMQCFLFNEPFIVFIYMIVTDEKTFDKMTQLT